MAFFKSLICFMALFATMSFAANIPHLRIVRASPPAAAANYAAAQVKDKAAQVVQYVNDANPADGSFSYAFDQDNGVSIKAKGYLNPNGKQVIEGSYTLYTQEGVPVSISYVADENGYNAIGDAIPQPDPIIAKAIAYQRSLPPSAEDEKA